MRRVFKSWLAAVLFTGLQSHCGGNTRISARPQTIPSANPSPATGVSRIDVATAWASLCNGPHALSFETAGMRDYVSVVIPGSSARLRFQIDTGGNTAGILVRRRVASELGFASTATMPRAIQIDGRSIALPSETAWEFSDDDSENAGLPAGLSPRKAFSDGQLGAGFLSRFTVCIDPKTRHIGLAEPTKSEIIPSRPWIPLLMQVAANGAQYPFVHVIMRDDGQFAGGYGLLLDTGATTSMLDRTKIDYQLARHPRLYHAHGAFGDADMIGGSFDEHVMRVDDAIVDTPRAALSTLGISRYFEQQIGPVTFVGRPDHTWSRMFGDVSLTMGSHGALGNDVLRNFRLLMDYSNRRLFLEPVAEPRETAPIPSGIGLSIAFGTDGCPRVTRISDTNSEDTKAALQIGDVIVAIDGQPTCSMWHHELSAALSGPAGKIRQLAVRRNGRPVGLIVAHCAPLLVARQ